MTNIHPAIEILESYKKIIWPEVKRYLEEPKYPQTFTVTNKYRNEANEAYWDIIKEYPERKGKYVRPSIIMLVSESMGVENKLALKTATAMQISEEWLLIHDDWEDNSTLRRGFPALHRIHGPELAVNAGDAIHIIMWKALLDNFKLLGNDKGMRVANEFFVMLSRTALGQGVEIKWMKENRESISDDDWFFIADGKTSYYTMAGPARLGGIIGGANDNQLNALSEFGLYLGRCFQLVDDLLDVTSDFSGLKEKANDIYEGKRTLILGHLARNASTENKNKLNKILSKSRDEKSAEEVSWVLEKMQKYGSIDYGWNIAKELKNKSEKIFEENLGFLKNKAAREKIRTLMNFILERKH